LKPFLPFLFVLLFQSAFAQKDSIDRSPAGPRVVQPKAPSKPSKLDSVYNAGHSPRKATIYSLVLPGLGQAYNHKYWKIPIIYAGAAALIYGLQWNQRNYKEFNRLFDYMTDNDTNTVAVYKGRVISDNYSTWALSNRNYFRKNRDLCAISLGLLYVMNVIDANVDAHLFEFNVNDDLSLSWEPRVFALNGYVYNGFGASIKF
jgi:hypothetical protein